MQIAYYYVIPSSSSCDVFNFYREIACRARFTCPKRKTLFLPLTYYYTMDDEFDEFLLDDYNIDTVNNNQRIASAVDDTNDDTLETTTSKKTFKKKFNADLQV